MSCNRESTDSDCSSSMPKTPVNKLHFSGVLLKYQHFQFKMQSKFVLITLNKATMTTFFSSTMTVPLCGKVNLHDSPVEQG